MAAEPQDVAAPEAPSDGISCLAWSPVQDVLAAGSWDQKVRIWEVSQQQSGVQIAHRLTLSYEAPILSCCFMKDGQRLITGGCDNCVRVKDLATQQELHCWQHDGPVKAVFSIDELNLIVSGSWDKTLRFWSPQQPTPVLTKQLPERVYSMDMKYPLLVVGCADRHILVYSLQDLMNELAQSPQNALNPIRQNASGLKMQTRSVSCFPDRKGYAVGSIEGRCSIVYFEDPSKTFTFRCHRKTGPDNYYALNAIDFHPSHGTFATCGSDGSYVFWDKENRSRLNQFNPSQIPISAAKFNSRGDIFAYAASYDWSKAHDSSSLSLPHQVMVHAVQKKDVEAKPNPKKQ